MAVIAMKKLTLIGHKSEQDEILKTLHYINCVELRRTDDFLNVSPCNGGNAEQAAEKLSRIEKAIEAVDERASERAKAAKKSGDGFEKPKAPLFFARREISFADFLSVSDRGGELLDIVMQVEKHSAELMLKRSELQRAETYITQLAQYGKLSAPLGVFRDTKNMKVMLGSVLNSMTQQFKESIAADERIYGEILFAGANADVVVLICHNEEYDRAMSIAGSLGFTKCSLNFDGLVSDELLSAEAAVKKINGETVEIQNRIAEFISRIDDLKLLADYYRVEVEKLTGEGAFKQTGETFIMQGYVPENCEELFEKTMAEKDFAATAFLEIPAEDEEVPTLVKNIKIVEPYESVTNLYSPPKATERDPNAFVGMFFFLFFGLMLSDAGYGLVLTALTFIIMKLFKMESGMKKLVLVMCMGGVSTVIWGALLGTWFGADVTNVPVLKHLMWFNPIEDPMKMLIICLALGLVHILFGLGVKAASLISEKKYFDAFADIGCWYIFFLGIILLIGGMFFEGLAILQTVGMITVGVSLLLILCTAGRAKKGIFGKIIGGFGGLYSIVNFMSDILSYSRLFGLGIATGVIGMTMNLMASMFFGAWYTVPFGIIILLIGHTFNLCINLLGAYIHNSRLQFVEFFGKFYEGGGYEFAPFGSGTQYVVIK